MPTYTSSGRTLITVTNGVDSISLLNVSCDAGVNIGDFVYLDSSFVAQKTSASATGTCYGVIGVVDSKPTSTTANIINQGLTSSIFSGLSAGSQYRLATTSGAITSSAPTNDVLVGKAYSATQLLVRIGAIVDTGGGGGGGGGSGIQRSITVVTTNTTAGDTALTDYCYFVSGSSVTLTMPTAVGNTNRYTIKNTDGSNSITVAFNGSETGDGSSTLLLRPNVSLDLVSDNSNWKIV